MLINGPLGRYWARPCQFSYQTKLQARCRQQAERWIWELVQRRLDRGRVHCQPQISGSLNCKTRPTSQPRLQAQGMQERHWSHGSNFQGMCLLSDSKVLWVEGEFEQVFGKHGRTQVVCFKLSTQLSYLVRASHIEFLVYNWNFLGHTSNPRILSLKMELSGWWVMNDDTGTRRSNSNPNFNLLNYGTT